LLATTQVCEKVKIPFFFSGAIMPTDQPDPTQPDATAIIETDTETETEAVGLPEDFEWKLLFDLAPELDADPIRAGLIKHGVSADPILISEVTHEDGGASHVSIDFDGHYLLLIRWPEPVSPETMTLALDCSNQRAADKQAMRKHRQHMVLKYLGGWEDPTERMIAMLRVAASFTGRGLKGLLDLPAWNALAAAHLPSWLKPDALAEMRKLAPLGILAGFVKLFKSEDRRDVCFCTKGLHRWGVNDFAMNGKLNDADQAFHLFEDLFAYSLKLEYLIAPGHTAEVGQTILRFSEVDDYPEMFATPLGTLLLERITRAKMH
jgi:hypothetical protein